MSIFSSGRTDCEGGVLRVDTGCAAPTIATISLNNFRLELPIVGYSLDLGTNHQFLHALDNFIYIYAFGNRIGELTLSGIAFTGSCATTSAGADISKQTSQCAILDYYNNSRVSHPGGPVPVKISLDHCTDILIGFLTGIRMEIPSPALPIVQWALRYNVILDEKPTGFAAAEASGGFAPGAAAIPTTAPVLV